MPKILKKWNYKDCPLFILQTFYDMRNYKDVDCKNMINCCEDFILDSGAFTFMNSGKEVHWKSYVDDYIVFINKYDIKHFIELDLYGVLGVEKTEKIRRYIEHHTEKDPIPVYHGTMPISYYRKLCERYDYVAISATGTLESSRWTRNTKVLKQVVKIGHSYGTKLHGLGYTRLANINKPEVLFDSVDSSSWLYGSRYGMKYKLKHGNLTITDDKDYKCGIRRTHDEWIKINMPVWIYKQKQLYANNQL